MHEISVAICSLMKSDATLVASLSSGSAIVFGNSFPHDIESRIPMIRVTLLSDVPDTSRNRLGVYDLRYQIDVLSNSPATNATILERLDEILHVPLKRGRISTDSYRSDRLYRLSGRPIKGRVEVGGKELDIIRSEWSMTAIKTG